MAEIQRTTPNIEARELRSRQLGRRNFLGFVRYTYKRQHDEEYRVSWHNRMIAEIFDRWAFGDLDRVMIFTHPRAGKSELVSRRGPAYILGRDPNAQVIAGMYNANLAAELSLDLQAVMESEGYHKLFPETVLPDQARISDRSKRDRQRADEFTIVKRRGIYRAAGVGGSITGKGMTHGIIDDPIKDAKDAESKAYRDALWNWYRSTFYTRQEGRARILITHTRWHEDDLAGRLLRDARDEGDEWTVLWLPALYEEDPPREIVDNPGVTLVKGDPRKIDEPLWPGKFDAAALSKIRKVTGKRYWSALYQNRPAPAGGNIIKREMIRLATWNRNLLELDDGRRLRRQDFTQRFSYVDLATTKKSKSDYTVVGNFLGNPTGRFLLLVGLTRGRYTGSEHERIILGEAKRYGSGYIMIEANAFQSNLIQRMKERRNPVRASFKSKDKISEAYSATPIMDRGEFGILGSLTNLDVIFEEILAFPNAAHDDIVDVIVGGCLHWDARMSVSTPPEVGPRGAREILSAPDGIRPRRPR